MIPPTNNERKHLRRAKTLTVCLLFTTQEGTPSQLSRAIALSFSIDSLVLMTRNPA